MKRAWRSSSAYPSGSAAGAEITLLSSFLAMGISGFSGGWCSKVSRSSTSKTVLPSRLSALVEAGAGLVAEEVLLEHLLQLRVGSYVLARLVLGGGLVEVLGDADGDVEADLVVQAEGGGPGGDRSGAPLWRQPPPPRSRSRGRSVTDCIPVKLPSLFPMKFGVSLAITPPLPRTRSPKSRTNSTTSGSVSSWG